MYGCWNQLLINHWCASVLIVKVLLKQKTCQQLLPINNKKIHFNRHISGLQGEWGSVFNTECSFFGWGCGVGGDNERKYREMKKKEGGREPVARLHSQM